MSSRSMAVRLGRTFGLAALALALTAPVSFAKEIGSGGTPVTPPPVVTAAPCATVADVLAQAKKGTGESIGIKLDFSIVSCSTNSEAVSYDLVLVGTRTGLTYAAVDGMSAGTLLAGKKAVINWAVPALPWNTGMFIDITVHDAGTGAVLATQRVYTGTPVHKV